SVQNQLDQAIQESGLSALPTWAMSGLDMVSAKVKSVQNANTLTFGFITDTHYMAVSQPYERSLRHLRFINLLSKKAGLSYIVNGGDFINGYKPKSQHCKEIQDATETFVNSVNCPIAI